MAAAVASPSAASRAQISAVSSDSRREFAAGRLIAAAGADASTASTASAGAGPKLDAAISASEIPSETVASGDSATGSVVSAALLRSLLAGLVGFMLVSVLALYLLKFLRSRQARKGTSAPADARCGCTLCESAWLAAGADWSLRWPQVPLSVLALEPPAVQSPLAALAWLQLEPPPPYSRS